MPNYDIAIIGAGITGITCALELKKLGKKVIILEKSRGVGGRLATRRLYKTYADHGTCYLSAKNPQFQQFIDRLITADIVIPWTNTVSTLAHDGQFSQAPDIYPRYIAPGGMSSIAKYLAVDLDIRLNHKATSIEAVDNSWRISIDSELDIYAKTVISTIPAPQALALIAPIEQILPAEFIQQLKSVEFNPNITIMAGYTPAQLADWYANYPAACAVTCLEDPHLAWLGVDSSKRLANAPPLFVLQSTSKFAEHHLAQKDQQPATTALLNQAGARFLPWLAHPQWQQTQLWRYAFAKTPLKVTHLSIEHPAPLIFTGDWCGGAKVENAMLAGLAVAKLFK